MAIPKELYQERLAAGLCPWCGGKRDQHTNLCSGCAETHARRTKLSRQRRADRGICATCKNKVKSGRYCEVCKPKVTAASKQFYAKKKKRKICIWCDEPATLGRLCWNCWFKSFSLKIFNTLSKGDELRKLFDQQEGCCFYTGTKLVPGQNASLDHQIPTTQGGQPSIENLRWVTTQINRIKNDLTHDEFVALCSNIHFKFNGFISTL